MLPETSGGEAPAEEKERPLWREIISLLCFHRHQPYGIMGKKRHSSVLTGQWREKQEEKGGGEVGCIVTARAALMTCPGRRCMDAREANAISNAPSDLREHGLEFKGPSTQLISAGINCEPTVCQHTDAEMSTPSRSSLLNGERN